MTDARLQRSIPDLSGVLDRLFLLTDGNWSVADLVEQAVDICGDGCDVWVLSWTIGPTESDRLAALVEAGHDVQVITDRSFPQRMKNMCARLVLALGDDRVRLGYVHAKVAFVRSSIAAFALHGSANFNRNPRLESLCIERDNEITDMIGVGLRAMLDGMRTGVHNDNAAMRSEMDAVMAQIKSETTTSSGAQSEWDDIAASPEWDDL